MLVLSIAYGLLTALAFAMWPLGRAHDVSVSMLFRDQVAAARNWPRRRYVIATAAIVAALAALAVVFAFDQRVAAMFVVAAALVFAGLRLLGKLTMAIARRLPRARSTLLRLAIANIHRRGALTPNVVLSLGLGLCLLVTVIEIDGNLHREFASALPEHAPSFFFLDIPSAECRTLRHFHPRQLAGRHAGTRADAARAHRRRQRHQGGESKAAEGSAWVLRGDRGITYAREVPAGSRIVEGEWWPANYSGQPLVSLESRTAADLDLKIGDTITVNVLGRNLTARIANLRAVEWENLGINFVLVFSPGVFAGAPHTDIATMTFADGGARPGGNGDDQGDGRCVSRSDRGPGQGSARRDRRHHRQSGAALRGASSVTLVAAALVLGGALAAGQRFRIYDAVILRTLGATRLRLLFAYALEYFLIGLPPSCSASPRAPSPRLSW